VLARQIHRQRAQPAEVLASLGSTVAFDALARGEIDAYVEYTGTIRSTLMHGRAPARSRRRSWTR
jgi:osmoprotectant transport system permease protein